MKQPYELSADLPTNSLNLHLSVSTNDWCKIEYANGSKWAAVDKFSNVADTLRLYFEDPHDPMFETYVNDGQSWQRILRSRDLSTDGALLLDGRCTMEGFALRLRTDSAGESFQLTTCEFGDGVADLWVERLNRLTEQQAMMFEKEPFGFLALPAKGKWLELTMSSPEENCSLNISTEEHDVLQEICGAVLKVSGGEESVATDWWPLEPYIARLSLFRTGDDVHVTVTWFDDCIDLDKPIERELEDVVFSQTVPLRSLRSAIHKQLALLQQEFGEQGYEKRVGHPFPKAAIDQLARLSHR